MVEIVDGEGLDVRKEKVVDCFCVWFDINNKARNSWFKPETLLGTLLNV
jgi:hypothetical protein